MNQGSRRSTVAGWAGALLHRCGEHPHLGASPDDWTTFAVGHPVRLFKGTLGSSGLHTYDVSSDGQRFLVIKSAAEDQGASPPKMVVVLNFFEELKRLVAAN
jgi:hypothetical protein